MKKLSYILLIAFTFIFIQACEEEQSFIVPSNLLSFEQSAYSANVDVSGVTDVVITVWSNSFTGGTFNLSVDTANSTGDPGSYTVPSSVTIPSGSNTGSFTVGLSNVNLGSANSVVINIEGQAGVTVVGSVTVNYILFCPVDSTLFVGDYRVTTVTPGVFGASTYGGDGNVVTLSVGSDSRTREFTANYFEDGRFPRTFLLNFLCNEVIVPYQDQLVGCGGNDVNLSTGPSVTGHGAYNVADDSSFTVKLTDNVDSDCGGGPVQTEYLFTKI